ncbi:MAG: hypothetical protein OEW67_05770 [Cyclobacteriaceae bacterium]|nr:hypothetical protein [Cyclobacteriaceae bacterium]
MTKIITGILLTGILSICMTGCNSSNNEFEKASILHYYCTFTDEVNTDFSKNVIDKIVKNINGSTYIITQQSGRKWPYFKFVDNPSSFPADSVLFPHPGLHMFHEFSTYVPNESTQFKVDVKLVTATETEVSLNEIVYKKGSSNDWKVLVDVGIIRLSKSAEMDQQSFIQLVEDEVILITFK